MAKLLRILITIVAVATICSAITEEQMKKAELHAKKCIGRIGVSRDDVVKVQSGDFSVKDKRIECFAKCFFEESGFMNADGEFLDAVAIDKLSIGSDRTKVEALVNTCKLKMGATPCESAYKIYQCYIKHKAL
ncbi:General odorant-binding protein 56d [Pseudolycoriella hygida]|uniref:General odorant-binding protein 56d n=1 Tax=Pseudolycoriella hygida TaxID=35572 RepID=A0A9Q0NEW1_9DIPT|nr:General odorant-binding protein 56d [Pseudolycoriella hygida]